MEAIREIIRFALNNSSKEVIDCISRMNSVDCKMIKQIFVENLEHEKFLILSELFDGQYLAFDHNDLNAIHEKNHMIKFMEFVTTYHARNFTMSFVGCHPALVDNFNTYLMQFGCSAFFNAPEFIKNLLKTTIKENILNIETLCDLINDGEVFMKILRELFEHHDFDYKKYKDTLGICLEIFRGSEVQVDIKLCKLLIENTGDLDLIMTYTGRYVIFDYNNYTGYKALLKIYLCALKHGHKEITDSIKNNTNLFASGMINKKVKKYLDKIKILMEQ